MASLSYGALNQMLEVGNRREGDSFPAPVLQVIRLKETSNRVRMAISDGHRYEQAMLTSQNQGMQVSLHSLIRIDEFVVNEVQGKKVIILLTVHVLETLPNIIGNPGGPTPLVNTTNQAAANAEASKPPQAHQPLYQPPAGNPHPPTAAASHPIPATSSNAYGSSTTNSYGASSSAPQAANPYGSATKAPRPAAPYQPVVRSSTTTSHATPIASLTMYNNRFTIQAKVIAKSDIRTWSNANGEGSLFSIDLLDTSGDIHAIFFKEAVDMFFGQLEIGQTYTFTGGRMKVANAKFNPCSSNFEITFDTKTEIHKVANDDSIRQTYNFVKIADLAQREENNTVDVIAVVRSVSDPVQIVSKKSGNELTKAELVLTDDSNAEICMTLWSKAATAAPSQYPAGTIAVFSKARISDFNGKSLNAGRSIDTNYNGEERSRLQHWWQTTGQHGSAATQLSARSNGRVDAWADRKMISSIAEENLGMGENTDWITVKGVLAHIRKDKEGGAWYTACPNAEEPCKNRYKVTATPDGQWHCEKCQRTYPEPVRRWIFSGVVEDSSGSTWVSFFNEQAESLLEGVTADQAYAKAYENQEYNQDAYDSVFAKAYYSEWVMKCKVKSEIHDGNARVKTAVYSMQPVNYAQESKELLAAIEQM